MQIFIHRNGQQFGPYFPEEIRSRLALGQFADGDWAWCEGWADWAALAAVRVEEDESSKAAVGDYNDPLTNPDAPWRADPVSQAQVRKLSYYGHHVEHELTKGEVSDLIDRLVARHPEKEEGYRKWKQLEEIIDEWHERVADCDFVDDGSTRKPTRQMVRETILALNDQRPNWSRREVPNGFAIILMKRYPQLVVGES